MPSGEPIPIKEEEAKPAIEEEEEKAPLMMSSNVEMPDEEMTKKPEVIPNSKDVEMNDYEIAKSLAEEYTAMGWYVPEKD